MDQSRQLASSNHWVSIVELPMTGHARCVLLAISLGLSIPCPGLAQTHGKSGKVDWAYVPPRRQPVPQVNDHGLSFNWIDRFIYARLRAEGLAPAPDADPATLLRRLSFDLTGLPPSPDDLADFMNEPESSSAYERYVDRLLASERFGERMAMYWLDLVRYADTVGYHGDQEHNISPYRDWVIDAINDDMPLDQFTREQLAGDLMSNAGVDQRIASGYNRLLQTSHEGGVQPKEYLAIYAADRVRNVSSVWLAATIGCCQCHDHKYDPFTMKDFYSLAAFFADIDEEQHLRRGTDKSPTVREPEIKVLSSRERRCLAELESQVQLLATRLAEATGSDEAGSEKLREELDELTRQCEQVRASERLTMVSVSIEPRITRILPRGNWLDESGPVVGPAVPDYLGQLETSGRRASRLDLAVWLTDADSGIGGLTARVFANRLWYLMFGAGIARDLEDFGSQAEPPVHGPLLDSLAVELVESGWSLKRLLKLIVLSRAYRQSSLEPVELREKDPYNWLFARQSRFRLPAEMVRDSALAISGLLVQEIGGPSVRPYQPADYYRLLNFPKRTYLHDPDSRQWRRGIYVHWQRQYLHPMLKSFDAPMREECTAQRPRSDIPQAALTLLNDPTFVEAARVFAERILREGGQTVDSRIDYAFLRAVSRRPDALERDLLGTLLRSSLEQYRSDPPAAQALVATGQSPPAMELNNPELAAWTAVARAILNMAETITRN